MSSVGDEILGGGGRDGRAGGVDRPDGSKGLEGTAGIKCLGICGVQAVAAEFQGWSWCNWEKTGNAERGTERPAWARPSRGADRVTPKPLRPVHPPQCWAA